ncbi:MAG: hypothetical protein LJU34_07695 [Oscillospiraceae bacterium]|nr:hypothetical protein [Oscillospiraceae bacterium]
MKHKIFAGIFLIMCLFPIVGILIFGVAEPAANETLSSWPSLTNRDGSFNTDILDDFSDYISDRFALRQEMVTLQHSLTAAVFHQSGESSVILGKDGWLFYAETLDDYEGINLMTDREVWAAARSLYLIQEYCESQGASFAFTIAPNKNSLYGEYMPDWYPASQTDGNAENLFAALAEMNVNYVELFSVFEAQDEILYRALDSHWSQRGAALAGDTLLSALNVDFDPFFSEEYEIVQEEIGDLYEMLYPTGTELDTNQRYLRDFSFTYVNAIRSSEDNMIRTVNEEKSRSLLMFRDSFGNALHSFMAEGFGSACFSRITPYELTMIASESADTVVIELVERNLDWLNTLPAVFPAPERDIDSDTLLTCFTDVTLSVSESDSLSDYTLLSGNLETDGLDDDSIIYIQTGGVIYEATPAGTGENPFSAYIPTEALDGTVTILYTCGGQLVCSQSISIYS